jgi:peptidoglycan L-alanyl-D-glutamate endopeptidase CwlK
MKFIKYAFLMLGILLISLSIGASIVFSNKQIRDAVVMGYSYFFMQDTDLDLLHPTMRIKTLRMIEEAKKQGIDLRVISGFRSMKNQDLLYSIGRGEGGSKSYKVTNAKAGKSYHNYGVAVDVVEYKNGIPNWSTKNWKLIGKLGKAQDLVWGGDWKNFKDLPHFQLPKRYWADMLR